jgi:6-phosphofructokinase
MYIAMREAKVGDASVEGGAMLASAEQKEKKEKKGKKKKKKKISSP